MSDPGMTGGALSGLLHLGKVQGKWGGGCPKEGLEIPGKGGWGFRTQDTVSAEVSSDPAVTGPRVVGGLSGQESGLEEESPLDLS